MNGTSAVSVFLVDDNSTFLYIVKRFLQTQDTIVVVGATPSGEETLNQIQALQPDVVLIDPFSLNGSGLESVSRLRALVPGAAIIVTTLVDIDAYRRAVLAAGADDFVPKATLAIDLLPAIRQLTRHHQGWQKPVQFNQMSYAMV